MTDKITTGPRLGRPRKTTTVRRPVECRLANLEEFTDVLDGTTPEQRGELLLLALVVGPDTAIDALKALRNGGTVVK